MSGHQPYDPLDEFRSRDDAQSLDQDETTGKSETSVDTVDCEIDKPQVTFTDPFDLSQGESTRQNSASSGTSYLRPGAFEGHRDTLARIPDLPHPRRKQLSDYYETVTGTSRALSQHSPPGQSAVPKVTFAPVEDDIPFGIECISPLIQRLPAELLQHIYSFLEPSDFDSARHTCRAWLFASLDMTLLRRMLKKSQCQNA
jgi:hypothetical protein